MWTVLTIPPHPYDRNNRDILAPIISFRPTATTATFKFHWFPEKGFYYITWKKANGMDNTLHRTKAFVPPTGTQPGDVVEMTALGFQPESRWTFALVSNPDPIQGEQ
jgi:hypothetical protein